MPPPDFAELLAARMKDRVFEANEIIYERGQAPGRMFFITEGKVALEAPDREPWLFEDHSLIGAIDANTEQPHRRTARAIQRSRAIEIHFEEYLNLLEDFFDFAKNMLIQAAHRTWEASLRVAPHQVFGPSVEPDGAWLARARLDEVQRIMILRNSRPFERAPVQALVTLARDATERRFQEGQSLWSAGDRNDGMYLVADGRLRVHHDQPQLEGWVGPGNFAQGVIELAPKPRVYSVDAQTDVVALRLSHEDLFDAMEEHFGLARSWWVYMGRENYRVREAYARMSGQSNMSG